LYVYLIELMHMIFIYTLKTYVNLIDRIELFFFFSTQFERKISLWRRINVRLNFNYIPCIKIVKYNFQLYTCQCKIVYYFALNDD